MSRRTPLKLLVLLVCATAVPFAYQSKQGGVPPKKDATAPEFFKWDRPRFVGEHLPITKSATCRFKKSVITMLSNVGGDYHPQVIYSSADGDEADTVSFIDLDTDEPKVVSNGGQASLFVLFSNPTEIALLNRNGGNVFGTEVYTVFKNDGAVLHSTQHRLGAHPSGVTEMGYCY